METLTAAELAALKQQRDDFDKNIPSTFIFRDLAHRGRATVTHFFAPAWRNPAVEVIDWSGVDPAVEPVDGVAGREAHERILRCERGHHHFADFALRHRVARARSYDLQDHTLVEDHALGDAAIGHERLEYPPPVHRSPCVPCPG